MRLQDFINQNVEGILVEWIAFARTRPSAAGLNEVALRDHAAAMLRQIAVDIATPQTIEEQREKSRGPSESVRGATVAPAVGAPSPDESPAEAHGADRATSGYTVGDMVAEFRALRASVLRLWVGGRSMVDADDLEDLMRFNEAIDQAVAESVSRFTGDLDHARDMFIAILSHDLRTPLQTVQLTVDQLLVTPGIEPPASAALLRAQRSTRRMHGMIDDLLDFTRSRMGMGIGVELREVDVAVVVREVVEEMAVALPDAHFTLSAIGPTPGRCDPDRLKQALGNLLANAVDHGLPGGEVHVSVTTQPTEILLEVRNQGTVIAARDMAGIFGPFKRLQDGATPDANPRHLGLGLYIADQIVAAHGGRIRLTSSVAQGTCFSIRLPRQG